MIGFPGIAIAMLGISDRLASESAIALPRNTQLALDLDLGYGYHYDVIIEGASITIE